MAFTIGAEKVRKKRIGYIFLGINGKRFYKLSKLSGTQETANNSPKSVSLLSL